MTFQYKNVYVADTSTVVGPYEADGPLGNYFDEAYERGMKLLNLKLAELDVNMFSAVNNSLINDGCGLFRGRLILPLSLIHI